MGLQERLGVKRQESCQRKVSTDFANMKDCFLVAFKLKPTLATLK